MHSLHVTVAIQGEFPDDAARQSHIDEVVAEISSKPGFMHGYWTAPIEGVGHAYTFYDTEENAKASAPPVGFEHHSGTAVIKDVDLRPVLAHL